MYISIRSVIRSVTPKQEVAITFGLVSLFVLSICTIKENNLKISIFPYSHAYYKQNYPFIFELKYKRVHFLKD